MAVAASAAAAAAAQILLIYREKLSFMSGQLILPKHIFSSVLTSFIFIVDSIVGRLNSSETSL